ncbi:ABC transporter permease [Sulfobacillus thermosulfidooxidans]|uniref:ABC transporter permease n=1 Tax=Sulfobacillus thermosulfidooxidans TaxID=28034 RepID=UPI0002D30343|nr:ABC transporter permease [Sulfobacillus thermosulfidooxidans]
MMIDNQNSDDAQDNVPFMKSSQSSRMRNWHRFFRNRKALLGFTIFMIFLLVAILAPWIAPYNAESTQFPPLQPPSWQHWFGTTSSGQDILSQLIIGSRISLGIGIGAGAMMTILAIILGMLPAYLGGKADITMNTLTNVMLVIPGIPLLIVIAAYIHHTGSWTLALVMGLTGWAWGARVLRSQTLTYVRRDFVVAARLAGASHLHILFREILPNMLSLVIANLMFGTLGAVLGEATLEFLGLGNPNAITWGTMLFWAQVGQALLNGAWWWLLAPGGAIALFGASMALMNSGVDELTNPRLRQPKRRHSESKTIPSPNTSSQAQEVHSS